MADRFKDHPTGLTSPARKIVAANYDAELTNGVCRGLLVETAGKCTVIDAEGGTATLVPLQQGYNPLCVSRLNSSGQTAAGIWALY